jgi:superfamily II DNA/RNA helicase
VNVCVFMCVCAQVATDVAARGLDVKDVHTVMGNMKGMGGGRSLLSKAQRCGGTRE